MRAHSSFSIVLLLSCRNYISSHQLSKNYFAASYQLSIFQLRDLLGLSTAFYLLPSIDKKLSNDDIVVKLIKQSNHLCISRWKKYCCWNAQTAIAFTDYQKNYSKLSTVYLSAKWFARFVYSVLPFTGIDKKLTDDSIVMKVFKESNDLCISSLKAPEHQSNYIWSNPNCLRRCLLLSK